MTVGPTPLDYAAWRESTLGSVTERLERAARGLRRFARSAGLVPGRVRGAVFHPPLSPVAVALAPLDPLLGRVTTLGASFVALEARKPPAP